MKELANTDSRIAMLIEQEALRQEHTINLIASENYVSPAVREASASVLTNKYAEGYPGKRYYAGCQEIDQVERIAIERACTLFGMDHANVQPHAGSQANFAVYTACLQPGDTILGMSLAHGGHLTHGHSVNLSGKLYKSVHYGVSPETEELDYDEIARLAHEHKPKLIIAGASAYSRRIDFARFGAIAKECGALLLADIAHIAGPIAAGLHETPAGYADFITTTTHKTLRGPRGGMVLCTAEWAERIDRAIMPGTQGGPFMHSIAAKAVALKEALQPSFAQYQAAILKNAQALASHMKGLGYRIVAGSTDNHLFIVDLRSQNVTGLQAQTALEKAGITVSRSCIPFDPQKPWITSGIRLGTPAITTRGMEPAHMAKIAEFLHDAIRHHDNELVLNALRTQVEALTAQFPLEAIWHSPLQQASQPAKHFSL